MVEKIITKEKVDGKPKKKYYKPKKKTEVIEDNVENIKEYEDIKKIKSPKKVGKYCIGAGDGYCIHFEDKPNWLHRKCMKLFLGWKWIDSKK